MSEDTTIKIYTESEIEFNDSGDFVLKDKNGNTEIKINISSIVHIVRNKDEVDDKIGGDLTVTTEVIDTENGLHNEFYELSFDEKAFEITKELDGKVKNKNKRVIINNTQYDHATYTIAL